MSVIFFIEEHSRIVIGNHDEDIGHWSDPIEKVPIPSENEFPHNIPIKPAEPLVFRKIGQLVHLPRLETRSYR